jgi:hypothetical protein
MKIYVSIKPTKSKVVDYNFEIDIEPEELKKAGHPKGLVCDRVLSLTNGLLLLAEAKGDVK